MSAAHQRSPTNIDSPSSWPHACIGSWITKIAGYNSYDSPHRTSAKCARSSRSWLGVWIFRHADAGLSRILRTDRRSDPFANRLEGHIKRRDDEDADERGEDHAAEHRGPDVASRELRSTD